MSFFKKLIKKKDDEKQSTEGSSSGFAAAGISTMSAQLQMKYAKGVQYNSKSIQNGHW